MGKVDYTIMSNVMCGCGKLIKKNVIDRNPDTKKCYACIRKDKGLVPRKEGFKSPRGPYQIGSKTGNTK